MDRDAQPGLERAVLAALQPLFAAQQLQPARTEREGEPGLRAAPLPAPALGRTGAPVLIPFTNLQQLLEPVCNTIPYGNLLQLPVPECAPPSLLMSVRLDFRPGLTCPISTRR